MNTEIQETEVLTEAEQVSLLLENLPTETDVSVEVPSGGRVYFGGKGGLIDIKPIHFEDEKALATAGRGASFNPANYLLSKCVKNVDLDDILLIDKVFLLLKIREISYGNDYKVGVACPNCSYENNLNLELDKLITIPVPEDIDVFNIPVHLRGLNKDAIVMTPTVAEEKYLGGGVIYDNLWRFVKSIEEINSPTVLSTVLSKSPIVDLHLLVNALSLSEYGLQPEIQFTCDSCSKTNLIALPIDANFFSVT